jgi:hypothetical protein
LGLSSRKILTSRNCLIFSGIVVIVALAACGKNGFVSPTELPSNNADSIAVLPGPTPAPQNEDLAICSSLALSGVVWPSSLDLAGRRSLALGLNISGSFEGGSGWKNITNNFDGQGLSLGLLNQCLGQGSLQPLLIKMRDRNAIIMRDEFGAAHLTVLNAMLAKWQGTVKIASIDMKGEAEGGFNSDPSIGQGDEDIRADGRLSDLDFLPDGSDGRGQQESTSSDSVSWAKQNLYTDGGTTFQATWKKELQMMSGSPSYVSIQIEAALSIHAKAIGYMKTLGLHELRSYLFLFDVNVQNGGLYAADIAAFNAVIPANSTADELTRLKKILALRLTHVVTKYKADVESRKLSIINGQGTVHGTARNYSKEFCFGAQDKLL